MATKKASFGSVRQLPSGRYQARYQDADGVVHNAPSTYLTRKAADTYLAGVQTDMVRGTWLDPSKGQVPFQAFADDVLTTRAYRLAPRTIAGYRSLLKKHINPTFGQMMLSSIEIRHIDAWHAKLSARAGPAVVRNAYMLMSGLFRQAIRQGLIDKSPTQIEGAAKEAATPRPTFSTAQFFAVQAEMPEELRLPLDLMLAAHLRLGELCGLERRDIDLAKGTVRVERQSMEVPGGFQLMPPKAGSRRTVTMLPYVLPSLETYIREHPMTSLAPLFVGVKGRRIPRGLLQREWTAARVRAGVPDMRLHDIRHVGLTLAAQGGATTRHLMRRAGHSTVAASVTSTRPTTAISSLLKPRPGFSSNRQRCPLRADGE